MSHINHEINLLNMRQKKILFDDLKRQFHTTRPKYFVPNKCATIPLVAGTVESHKKPKLAPNKKALILLAGVNIKRIIEIPLKK